MKKKSLVHDPRSKHYTPIIGMEVHIELKTLSKMFCGCPAEHFNIKPNSHTCPVCLGLPGSLPVPNKKAVEWTIMLGLALGCKINKESKFDRKHYFYPDLPKGYQISQYDQPLCINGKLKIDTAKLIRINRVHLEEDTGKLIHATVKGKKVSLVDFNRSGVPLVEIVTEPDIGSAKQATEYVKRVQQVVRYLGISDCDMEKGSMRLEANISLTADNRQQGAGSELPQYKVEVKNLNSFRFLKRAISYEVERQAGLLKAGKTPRQETRGWDENQKKTVSQRSKEEAQDYRYFPEPDIPPMIFDSSEIKKIRGKLPELPAEREARLVKTYRISQPVARVLISKKALADYFEAAAKVATSHNVSVQQLANILVNKRVDINKYLPAELIKMLLAQTQSQVSDPKQLLAWIKQTLKNHPQAAKDFQAGKHQALGFLIGQVQRLAKGKADVKAVRSLLAKQLKG